MLNSEKLGTILKAKKDDKVEEIYKVYNELLKLAKIHRDSNIQSSIAQIVYAYFKIVDYPHFLKTSKIGMEIPQNLAAVLKGTKFKYEDKELQKLNMM